MKVIVDIKNKTLKMLENERSIFKGEYSADKLELYINKQLENEYPVITGLLSNGRRIGAFTTDDGYEMETIDDVEYTKAKFTLSKENGFPLSAGVTQITIWMYRTKDSVLVSKEAIGNVVFTVVDTTAFNDGDIIISGDVEGTVVNLKVEVENLQQVAQINNVAINNLQNNKADKTTLNDYLKRDGSKPMTGDLDMDYYDITNTRLYDKETHNYIALSGLDNGALPFSSKSGALELRSPEMDDLDTANFLIYPTPENTNHIAGQEYETYEWNLPKESGTIALDKDIPTKLSQLEQDVELGVSEEDVINIIKNNAEQTNTLDIGTSATFDATSDEQIPTSKAVSNLMASAGGLYTQYLKFSITGDDDVTRDYSISLNTSKPITNLEEFRTYIINRLIYSDSPTFGVTFLHFMILTNSEPVYLAYSCAYYGAPMYTIQEIMTSNNSITNITEGPYISSVLDRMKDFEVLTTIKN